MGMEQGPFPNPFFIVDLGAYDALSPQLYPLYSEISAAKLLLLLFLLEVQNLRHSLADLCCFNCSSMLPWYSVRCHGHAVNNLDC